MISNLQKNLKCLALLDAIIEPEWEYRYYSYNSKWGPNEEMASLRDSCGGEWFVLFFENNIAFKCTSPEDGLAKNFEELKKSMPVEFSGFISEPAFSMSEGSCLWYVKENKWIKLGENITDLPTPDTINEITAKEYCNFAEEIYEKEIDPIIIESVFNGKFTLNTAKEINPNINISNLQSELLEIGINS